MSPHPAIGLLEVSSLARGLVVTDAVVKRAAVTILGSHPISPGRYLTLFRGGVAEVEEAFAAGEETGREVLVDSLLLPAAHEQVLEALGRGRPKPPALEALGIVETWSVAAALLSADAACKAAEVELLELRLAHGLGGKGLWVVTAELHDVEAALDAARGILRPEVLVRLEVIPRPHPDLLEHLWQV
ncbi:MAG: BMC domain-containing protein [Deltaproteobacteria bacterium]|nr:BMC domain-containing protein [Deltaproteobacteria bacterium]